MHTVATTSAFERHAKNAGMTDHEIADAIAAIASAPQAGDLIPGTGGCRKVRVAGRGKGKSGGYRVITYFVTDSAPVYLLTVFGKGEKSNLTNSERNALHSIAKAIAAELKERPHGKARVRQNR